jgi:hypothetical protein
VRTSSSESTLTLLRKGKTPRSFDLPPVVSSGAPLVEVSTQAPATVVTSASASRALCSSLCNGSGTRGPIHMGLKGKCQTPRYVLIHSRSVNTDHSSISRSNKPASRSRVRIIESGRTLAVEQAVTVLSFRRARLKSFGPGSAGLIL